MSLADDNQSIIQETSNYKQEQFNKSIKHMIVGYGDAAQVFQWKLSHL